MKKLILLAGLLLIVGCTSNANLEVFYFNNTNSSVMNNVKCAELCMSNECSFASRMVIGCQFDCVDYSYECDNGLCICKAVYE